MTAGPRAVLWDLDGTLIDTEPYWMAAEFELAAQYRRVWTEADARSVIGFDLLDAAAVMIARTGMPLSAEEIVERLVSSVIQRMRHTMPWRPGARELLDDLRRAGMPCGLVTMSWRNLADEVLAQLPTGTFAAIVTGDSVDNGKPHPEPYRRAAAALGVEPADCVAIEDSPTGIASAEAAGCKVVAVPNILAIDPGPNRIVINSLTDLAASDFLPAPAPSPAAAPRATAAPVGVAAGRPETQLFDAEADPDHVADHAPTVERGGDFGFVIDGGRGSGDKRLSRRTIILCAVVVLAIVAAVVWQTRRTPEPHRPSALNVQTWAPYWTLDDAADRLATRAGEFHQLSPFWYSAVGVDQIVVNSNADADEVADFLDTARGQGATIIPSIVDENGAGVMAALISDPAQRTRHIDAIVQFAADGDYPGIDLDYERFAFSDARSTWAETRPNWVAFVTELAEKLHADGRTLTVTVPPIYDDGQTDDSGYWVYDHAAIGEVADVVRIMAYDFSTSSPGPIAPLDWVESVIAASKDVIDDDSKIVLGIPMYGYNWPIATEGTCPEGEEPERTSVSTRGIPELAARRDATPVYDPATGESTFTYRMEVTDGTATCTVTREVHFVDAQGVEARIRLALDEGVGGVALWAFGFDDDATWAVLDEIAAELAPTTTTTG